MPPARSRRWSRRRAGRRCWWARFAEPDLGVSGSNTCRSMSADQRPPEGHLHIAGAELGLGCSEWPSSQSSSPPPRRDRRRRPAEARRARPRRARVVTVNADTGGSSHQPEPRIPRHLGRTGRRARRARSSTWWRARAGRGGRAAAPPPISMSPTPPQAPTVSVSASAATSADDLRTGTSRVGRVDAGRGRRRLVAHLRSLRPRRHRGDPPSPRRPRGPAVPGIIRRRSARAPHRLRRTADPVGASGRRDR